MLLWLAAALPTLLWDAGPETAPALRDAGIAHVAVPAARMEAWKGIAGISVEVANLQETVKLPAPSVDYRINQGGATRAPWINSNGWRFLRRPQGRFYCDVHGAQAALAAAEAFSYRANALIRTDDAGLKPFAAMLEFLRALPPDDLPPVADIGFVDDGSAAAGEVMNLMVRGNLLFKIVPAPDPRLKLTVRPDPKENPSMAAHEARSNLTDERRSLRIYGSQVVVARLTGSGDRMRVQLLNYDAASRKVDGIRVRVLGRFVGHKLAAAASPGEQLLDYTLEPDATEFTLPELKTFAVIDLTRR